VLTVEDPPFPLPPLLVAVLPFPLPAAVVVVPAAACVALFVDPVDVPAVVELDVACDAEDVPPALALGVELPTQAVHRTSVQAATAAADRTRFM
jgi:hypothetical protein